MFLVQAAAARVVTKYFMEELEVLVQAQLLSMTTR
jgi:hypothetical protein